LSFEFRVAEFESSAARVSLEGRLEEAELARSGFEGAMVFGCVSDGSRMMLIFSVFAVS
jgi:hypothetical protein